MKVRKKHSAKMGCYLNVRVCLPDKIKSENIVGLLGSPNGDTSDDFMDADGTNLNWVNLGKTEWEDGYNYGTQNWCIRGQGVSLFKDPMDPSLGSCDEPYDDTLANSVANAPDDIKEICGVDINCLIESMAGDIEDGVDSVRELEENFGGLDTTPKPTDTDVEEEDEVFEQTTVKPASDSVVKKTSAVVEKTSTPGTYGDPHVVTFGGQKFDFHAACDLVLLDNPNFRNGTGMTVHIRTKLHTWWSFVQAASIRIGDDVLEVMGGDHDYTFWVNGVEGATTESTLLFSQLGLKVQFKPVNSHQLHVRVDLSDGDAIALQTYKHFVRVDIKANHAANYIGSSGLMGSFPSGTWFARDNNTVLQEANKFGAEWQVKNDEPKLFRRAIAPQHPATCHFPSAKESKRRRLQESSISKETAERACAGAASNFVDCVSDVLATNDETIAGAY